MAYNYPGTTMKYGSTIPTVGNITEEYCRKYPAVSNYKLARMLLAAHPEHYSSLETARNNVRYYRGSHGASSRKNIDKARLVERWVAPETDDSGSYKEPYIIPDDAHPIVAIGDVHLPYHSRQSLELAINHAIASKCKTLVLAGDIIDCYQVSRWERDPRLRSIESEITVAKDFLSSLIDALPDCKIVYKFGNHEQRLDKYVMAKAPELFGLDVIKLQNLLGLDDMGIDYISPMQIIRYRQLNIIHGHEYVFSISNPVNAARGLFLRAKKTSMTFHHHRTSEHTETSINDDTTTCWSVGCLCELKPAYMPLNSWNHGFAEISGHDDMFQVQNHRIISGRIV